MLPLYCKHLLVRTPLEGWARRLRHAAGLWRVLRHPGLRDVYFEEWHVERLLRALVKPDSNCVDVGAHIGSTLSSLVALAPRGRHLAFEPVARKAAWLRRRFPEVDVRAVALGETTGYVSFGENLSRPGYSGLGAAGGGDRVRTVTVECDRLDNVVGPDRRVDFLKVDAEGAELLVLRGAAGMLKRDRPAVLFESTPGGAEKLGTTRGHLFDFLTTELGYSVYLIKDHLRGGPPLDLAAFDRSHQYPFRAFNYLAVR